MWCRVICNCGQSIGEFWDAWKSGNYTLDELGVTAQCCRIRMISIVEFQEILDRAYGKTQKRKVA